ncbi:YhbD family protein [Sporolactobacillus sp. CPB3-1]|uniref:YhbD family protein n=1 Tax=Sporolactobacillus mangiferae TaxID=2940498 RepID=A0ABT0M981_9BACL|nr:YhbD family protein [Sporolactobacillus mangiferae]
MRDEELITKKELLERTGISYGQLYRWKRKQLIPESWFIRKATFTGQETFFPKEKILKRVQAISEMKDNLSLDELAEKFSPRAVTKIVLTEQELLDQNIVSEATLIIFKELAAKVNEFRFDDLLTLSILDQMLKSGQMNRFEAQDLLDVLKKNSSKIYDKNGCLYFVRKMGVSIVFITEEDVAVYLDEHAKLIGKQRISAHMERLKAVIERTDPSDKNREDLRK